MTDRRYGSPNKYGNGRLYGTSDAPIVNDRFQWGVNVSWDNPYGGGNEAAYMTSLYVFRGRRKYINPNGQGFAPLETGRARVTLDNSDGRYDGWNTSSPLYPNVTSGKDIRIRLRDLDSGATYSIFTGTIVDIETFGYGGNAKVVLVCEDGWNLLRNNTVYAGAVREFYTITRILNIIFGVEFSSFINPFIYPHGTNFEVSTDTIAYWWSSNSILIGDMVDSLVQPFFGKFFIASDGKATFYDRQSTRTSSITYDQSQFLKDISNPQPWSNQRTSVKIKVRTRRPAANQVVWELSSPVDVSEGETLVINPIFTYNGVVTPARNISFNATADYLMNSQEDGGGVDLTDDFIVQDPLSPFSLYGSGMGDAMIIQNINNSSMDGYITEFEIFGEPIYELGTTDVSYPPLVSGSSRELLIDSIWHQRIRVAGSFVRIYGPQIAAVRQFPVITFDTRPEALTPDLFDIVTVSIDKLGIADTDFEVGGIEIETTTESCQSFTVKQYLEPHLLSS